MKNAVSLTYRFKSIVQKARHLAQNKKPLNQAQV